MEGLKKFSLGKRMLAIALIAMLVALLNPVGAIPGVLAATPNHPGVFTVSVTSDGTTPVVGAVITFTNNDGGATLTTVTTGDDGVAEVPAITQLGDTLETPTLDYTIIAVGYEDYSGDITLTDDPPNYTADLPVTLTALDAGIVSGTVTESVNGPPIRNVAVSLSGYADFGPVYTDANGEYSIPGVYYMRDYTITAVHPNYKDFTAYITPTHEYTPIPIALTKEDGLPEVEVDAVADAWANELTITGTATDDKSGVAEVYYRQGDEGDFSDDVILDNDGKFSFTVTGQNYQGNYQIYCTDNAGNVSATETVAVKLDSTAPTLDDVEADPTAWTKDTVEITGTAADAQINGVASGVEKVYYKQADSEEEPDEVTPELNGSFTIQLQPQTYGGDYIIYSKDNAGNESEPKNVAVKMDTTGCVVSIVTAEPDDWTNEAVKISGTISDSHSGVDVEKVFIKKGAAGDLTEIDNLTKPNPDINTWNYEYVVEAQNYEGEYFISATDTVGNTPVEGSVDVYMDITAPVVDSADADETDWTSGPVVISGEVHDVLSNGVCSDIDRIIIKNEETGLEREIAVNPKNPVTNTWTYSYTLEAQEYAGNYIVYCVDKAGNESDKLTKVAVKMSNAKPTITAAAVQTNWTNGWTNNSVTIEGTVISTLTDIEKIYIKKDEAGEVFVEIPKTGWTAAGTNEWDYKVVLPAADYKGDYILYCINGVGTASLEATVSVQMDNIEPTTAAPSIDISDWTNGSVKITGTVSDNLSDVDKIYIKKGDAGPSEEIKKKEKTSELNWSYEYEIAAQSYAGDYIIYCVDKANNVSAEQRIGVLMDNEKCVVLTYGASPSGWTNGDVVISGTADDNLSNIDEIFIRQGENGTDFPIGTKTENSPLQWSYSHTVTKQDYEGVYIVSGVDKAGNTAIKRAVPVQMDITAPTIGTVSADITDWTNTDVVITGTAGDNLSGVNQIFYKQGADGEPVEIANNGGIFQFTVPRQNYEGDFIIYCTDNAGNQSDPVSDNSVVSVKMDITDPAQPAITYDKTAFSTVLETVTLGFYKAPVVATVTSSDNLAGVEKIEYSYTGKKGEYVTEVVSVTGTLNAQDGSIQFTIPEGTEFKGAVKAKAYDRAGNVSAERDIAKDGAGTDMGGIIVDNIPPARTVTYPVPKQIVDKASLESYSGDLASYVNTENTSSIFYYDGNVNATLKITEANFYAEDVSVKVNNTEYPVKWTHSGAEHTATVSLSGDGDYVITASYTDRSTNAMKSYTSEQITIDTVNPVVSVSYSPNRAIHTLDGRTYYDAVQTATITITEHNFRADDVAAAITARDASGNNIAASVVSRLTSHLRTRGSWTKSGDRYTATITYSADANYNFDIDYADLALRKIANYSEDLFTVDTTAPTNLQVSFSETVAGPFLQAMTFGYYQAPVRVTLTATDDVSGIYRFMYSYARSQGVSSVNAELINAAISNAAVSYSSGRKTATATFTIPRSALSGSNQFNGTVAFTAYDRSENETNTRDPRVVIVDNIEPSGTITFNEPVQTVNNISYFDSPITATIAINEANFNAEDVVIQVNGTNTTPSNWTQSGDEWTSAITLAEEGDYAIGVSYTDRSTNAMTQFTSNLALTTANGVFTTTQLTVDLKDPVIAVSDVKHESANNAETIGFVLTVTDRNIGIVDVKPAFTATLKQDDSYAEVPVDIGTAATSTNSTGETVYTYIVENLEADGFYSLNCSATDYAGHSVTTILAEGDAAEELTTEAVQFSVNRLGSTFWFETSHNDKYANKSLANELNKQYANDVVKVVLHEINVDTIDIDGENRPELTINDGSQSISVDLNSDNFNANTAPESRVGVGGWYENIYTLETVKNSDGTYAEDFDHDGTYSMNIVTRDRAANNNVFSEAIGFVVDRTAPVITSNVNTDQRINAPDFAVEFRIADANLDPATLVVNLQGETIEPESLGNNEYRFNVTGAFQSFDIEAKDMAQNPAELYSVERLTVSTNFFVLWFANTVLFWSTVGGVVLLAGLLTFFLIFRKRRRQASKIV